MASSGALPTRLERWSSSSGRPAFCGAPANVWPGSALKLRPAPSLHASGSVNNSSSSSCCCSSSSASSSSSVLGPAPQRRGLSQHLTQPVGGLRAAPRWSHHHSTGRAIAGVRLSASGVSEWLMLAAGGGHARRYAYMLHTSAYTACSGRCHAMPCHTMSMPCHAVTPCRVTQRKWWHMPSMSSSACTPCLSQRGYQYSPPCPHTPTIYYGQLGTVLWGGVLRQTLVPPHYTLFQCSPCHTCVTLTTPCACHTCVTLTTPCTSHMCDPHYSLCTSHMCDPHYSLCTSRGGCPEYQGGAILHTSHMRPAPHITHQYITHANHITHKQATSRRATHLQPPACPSPHITHAPPTHAPHHTSHMRLITHHTRTSSHITHAPPTLAPHHT